MSRLKKRILTRDKYKEIKKMDHSSMNRFITGMYEEGYQDGQEIAQSKAVGLDEIQKAIQNVKGVGTVTWKNIECALASLFKE